MVQALQSTKEGEIWLWYQDNFTLDQISHRSATRCTNSRACHGRQAKYMCNMKMIKQKLFVLETGNWWSLSVILAIWTHTLFECENFEIWLCTECILNNHKEFYL